MPEITETNHLLVDARQEDKDDKESEEEAENSKIEYMKEEKQEADPNPKVEEKVGIEGYEDPIYKYDDEDDY